MTSLVTCDKSQEEKIQIMLTFYEQGLLKYGQRGRPTKTKLLKRYTDIFEPCVQLTDISSLLQDTEPANLLHFSDLPVKSRDKNSTEFNLQNSSFYLPPSEHGESQEDTSDHADISSDGGPTLWQELREGKVDDCDSSETDNTDIWMNNDSLSDSECLPQDLNDPTQEVDSFHTDTSHIQTPLSDSPIDGDSDKLIFMAGLGLEPAKDSLGDSVLQTQDDKLTLGPIQSKSVSCPHQDKSVPLQCPPECENIFESFQKFIAEDELSKPYNINRDTEHEKSPQSLLYPHTTENTPEPYLKVSKISSKPVPKKGPLKSTGQNGLKRGKFLFSQGGLKKNLKMFARDLQIYAHQRQVNKSKVHIREGGLDKGSKKTEVVKNITKEQQMEQDAKLKEVICKLKGKHFGPSFDISMKTVPLASHSENNTCTDSGTKSDSVSKTSDSRQTSESNMTSKLCSEDPLPSVHEAKEDNRPLFKSQRKPCHSSVASNLNGSTERKQYFMRQRRLAKFPSTIPSSVLKFIRAQKTSCKIKSKAHLQSKKSARGLSSKPPTQPSPTKAFNGGFSKKRNALDKHRNTETDSSTRPLKAEVDSGKSPNCRKRKLSTDVSPVENPTPKCATENFSPSGLTENNSERYLKEFSRHNWLINKYRLHGRDKTHPEGVKSTTEEKQDQSVHRKSEVRESVTSADYGVTEAPPMLIPVSESVQRRAVDVRMVSPQQTKEELPEMPPLKHDRGSVDIGPTSKPALTPTTTHSITSQPPSEKNDHVQTDVGMTCKPVSMSPKLITIAPTDEEPYSQVPTPLASSPNECEARNKPSLLPLQDSGLNPGTSTPRIECNVPHSQVEGTPILTNNQKPIQIVNTSFLPGSVVVLCNTPISSSSGIENRVLSKPIPFQPVPCTLTSNPLLGGIPPLNTVPTTNIHRATDYKDSTQTCHEVSDGEGRAGPQQSVSRSEVLMQELYYNKSLAQSSSVKSHGHTPVSTSAQTKKMTNFVDLTEDSPPKATGEGNKTEKKGSRPNSPTSGTKEQDTTISPILPKDLDQPELKKLRQEYLKFSKIFKRLTDIEEMKEKERQVLQEKKVQATMLMQTILKQYESIKKHKAPTSTSDNTVSRQSSVSSSSDGENSAMSVQAHSKQNRVKLLIGCEPPPAHKNSSKCIDYVSLSNMECDFVSNNSEPTPQEPKESTVPVYSVHLKGQEKERESDKCSAVDLSKRTTRQSPVNRSTEGGTPSKPVAVSSDIGKKRVKSPVTVERPTIMKSSSFCPTNTTDSSKTETVVSYEQTSKPVSSNSVPKCITPQTTSHVTPSASQKHGPVVVNRPQPQWPAMQKPQESSARQQPVYPRPLPPRLPATVVTGPQRVFRPQKVTPYRLGNLVQTQRQPFMVPNPALRNISPRVLHHNNASIGIARPLTSDHRQHPMFGVNPPPQLNVQPVRPVLSHPLPFSQRSPVSINPTLPQTPVNLPLVPVPEKRPLYPFAPIPQVQQRINTTQLLTANPQYPQVFNPKVPQCLPQSPPKPQPPVAVQSSQPHHTHAPSPQTKTEDSVQVQSMWMKFNKGTLKCGVCQKKAMFVCSRCKEMPYCSEYCQTESWTKHAAVCQQKK